MDDIAAAVIRDVVSLLGAALKAAVIESPTAGINLIAEHFEEVSVDDPETRDLLDEWWDGQGIDPSQRPI